MPTPEMAWQEPAPHSPFMPLMRKAQGVQISAQYESPVGLRKAHVGFAVAPEGKSLGQLPDEHFGLQKSPDRSCTWTACSSDSQPPAGSP